jgi:hypothetical protein
VTEHHIVTLEDVAKLTPEEFTRFLPDFVEWHRYAAGFAALGGLSKSFVWYDDGNPGEVRYFDLTVEETGQKIRIDVNGEVMP